MAGVGGWSFSSIMHVLLILGLSILLFKCIKDVIRCIVIRGFL